MYEIIPFLNFETEKRALDTRIFASHENRKENRNWKIRRKEVQEQEKRERERRWADRSTGIRAPRALPGEDVQRLCPRARRIRVTGTFPPVSRPWGLPCFILVYHPVMRSPRRLACRLRRHSRPAFSFLQFQSKRRVSVVRGKKISIDICILADTISVIKTAFNLVWKGTFAGTNDDRESMKSKSIWDVKWLNPSFSILILFLFQPHITLYTGC